MDNLNKRGQFSFIIGLVIVIVVGLLLIFLAMKFGMKLSIEGSIDACHLSVIAQANTKLIKNPVGDKSPFNINCDKRYITFYNDHATVSLNNAKAEPLSILINGKQATSYGALDDYVVNQVMAEEMRICYYEFGEGKQDVFDTSMTNGLKGIFYGNDVCFVCSEATFDKSVQPNTYTGFNDYIKRTYINADQYTAKMTYYDYFNQPSLSQLSWKDFTNIYYNTGQISFEDMHVPTNYAVVFTKQDKRLQELSKQGVFSLLVPPLAVVTIIRSVFTDANKANNNYYVQVMPTSRLNEMCDIVAN